MSSKGKGTAAERELQHALSRLGFAAMRIAGSGSSPLPACDVIAADGNRRFCFEVKSVDAHSLRLSNEQLDELLFVSKRFSAVAVLAVHWERRGWTFSSTPQDLARRPDHQRSLEEALSEFLALPSR